MIENPVVTMKEFHHGIKANDILTEPVDSILPHVLLYAVQLVTLVSPKFPGRRFVFSGILLALLVQAQLHPHFTEDISKAQPFCIQWSFLLASLEKLLLSGDEGPERHFWRIDAGKEEAESYPAFGLRKLKWAIAMFINQRGVGWNYEVKNVPQCTDMKKSTFVRKQLVQLVKYYILADLCFQLGIWFFYTNPETGIVGDIDSKLITLEYACPGWIFVTRYVFAATPYFALSMQYTLFSIIGVSLGLGTPKVGMASIELLSSLVKANGWC
jgi:hypothetical protein